jgi:hypothetical protein
MRRFLRALRFAIVAALMVAGVLVLFLPGNLRPEDGSADPILELRRPVLGLMRDVGLAPEPFFLFPDPWLPSGFETSSRSREGDGAWHDGPTTRVHRTPVYRGLFWRVGVRLRMEQAGDDRYRALRLVVVDTDGRAQAVDGAARDAASSSVLAVEGFVPDGWQEWRLEGLDANGVAHEIRSEGRSLSPRAP